MRRHSPRRQQRPECLRMPLRPYGCAHNGIARRRIGGNNTAHLEFDQEITALLVIDPYNDFISEGGKVWDRLKTVAEANNCVPHMLQVLTAARKAGLRVFWNGYLPPRRVCPPTARGAGADLVAAPGRTGGRRCLPPGAGAFSHQCCGARGAVLRGRGAVQTQSPSTRFA